MTDDAEELHLFDHLFRILKREFPGISFQAAIGAANGRGWITRKATADGRGFTSELTDEGRRVAQADVEEYQERATAEMAHGRGIG